MPSAGSSCRRRRRCRKAEEVVLSTPHRPCRRPSRRPGSCRRSCRRRAEPNFARGIRKPMPMPATAASAPATGSRVGPFLSQIAVGATTKSASGNRRRTELSQTGEIGAGAITPLPRERHRDDPAPPGQVGKLKPNSCGHNLSQKSLEPSGYKLCQDSRAGQRGPGQWGERLGVGTRPPTRRAKMPPGERLALIESALDLQQPAERVAAGLPASPQPSSGTLRPYSYVVRVTIGSPSGRTLRYDRAVRAPGRGEVRVARRVGSNEKGIGRKRCIGQFWPGLVLAGVFVAAAGFAVSGHKEQPAPGG